MKDANFDHLRNVRLGPARPITLEIVLEDIERLILSPDYDPDPPVFHRAMLPRFRPGVPHA
ncbi:MAG TPA: hypothetical protein VEA41_02550 [Salinarimonas sp.]|nr:hypothetical protein [Salinarimonas sp.]